MSNILDYHLQHSFRRMLSRLPEENQAQVKSMRLCNVSLNPHRDAVYLLVSNKGDAKFYGHTTCKNPFACPVCSAKMMEHYRSKIAAAIEALRDEWFGFMVTFAIPHIDLMSCRETMDILQETWKYFRQKYYDRSHGHKFDEFRKATGLLHYVKVMEHTWGKKHGWHPHFHCIFWVPRGNEEIASEREKELCDFWEHCARRITLKYWQKHKLHPEVIKFEGEYGRLLDRMYLRNTFHKGVFFSRNKDGSLREVQSAYYLTGWSADKELTGNIRKESSYSHMGHMTPYQILTKADTDPEMEKLYMEFTLAVTKRPYVHRVHFSITGINKIIKDWQKEHGKKSAIIQKKSQEDGTPTRWHIVAFFDKIDWYELSCLNRTSPVLSNILYYAAHDIYLLGDYLSFIGITPSSRIPPDYNDVEALFSANSA